MMTSKLLPPGAGRAATAWRRRRAAARQRGSALLMAMMAVVVLGLAAVALIRSVDTGTLIMGNLGFKQDVTATSATGAELAMNWLQSNLSLLGNDVPAAGYYASSMDNLDVTGNLTSASQRLPVVNWDGNYQGIPAANRDGTQVNVYPPYPGMTLNGNKVQWVITRLCDYTDTQQQQLSSPNFCASPLNTSTSQSQDRGALQSGGRIVLGNVSYLYRIIVRTEGPRNTVSYTETQVHF